MKRFQRLISLTEYIEGFSLPGISPIVTTAQADATSKLQHLSGVQVLAARPECRQQGDSDSYSSVLSTAFFVVAKGLGPAGTPERERKQYGELLDIASQIVERVAADSTAPHLRASFGDVACSGGDCPGSVDFRRLARL